VKKNKVLVSVLLGLCLVLAGVAGTLAFLTSESGTVKNTFTVGNVKILLDEATVKTPGEGDTSGYKYVDAGGRTTTGNTYEHLMPGDKVYKDPTITVDANSQDCWVFMEVTLSKEQVRVMLMDWIANMDPPVTDMSSLLTPENAAAFAQTIINYDSSKWTIKAADNGDAVKIVLQYNTKLSASDKAVLFTELSIPATLSNDELKQLFGNDLSGSLEMSFFARAIQADNVTAAEAFTALYTTELNQTFTITF